MRSEMEKASESLLLRVSSSNSKFKTHRTSSILFLEDSCPKGNLLSLLKTSLLLNNL
jgi:hypothetical protein